MYKKTLQKRNLIIIFQGEKLPRQYILPTMRSALIGIGSSESKQELKSSTKKENTCSDWKFFIPIATLLYNLSHQNSLVSC
jgi:hypothetical protein